MSEAGVIKSLFEHTVDHALRQVVSEHSNGSHSAAYNRSVHVSGTGERRSIWTLVPLTGDTSLPEAMECEGANAAFPLARMQVEVICVVATQVTNAKDYSTVILHYRPGACSDYSYSWVAGCSPELCKFPGYVGALGNFTWFRARKTEA